MMRWLRKLVLLGALAGGGYGAYRIRARRQPAPPEPPQWPPLSAEPRISNIAKPLGEPVAEPAPLWLAPVDGSCPDGYPVKANDNSRNFHVPGGRFYARTVAERCYANADDAVADGYRQAKA